MPRVWQPDEATQRLRELASRRSALVGQRTAVRNRIHSVLAMRLVTPPTAKLFSPAGVAWLRSVELDPQGRLLVDTDLRLAAAIEAEIAVLEQELAVRGYQNPQVRLLMTLPGVDVTVAESLVAALGDATRFADGAHAASLRAAATTATLRFFFLARRRKKQPSGPGCLSRCWAASMSIHRAWERPRLVIGP